ncbi:MAG: outer membrane lipoprotein chaperone LolA [Gemmatimonadetes bacterium]|nr:outer membrane lipoprotein chaperone LolA [Gemmatimonadota bacterium]
MNTTTLRRTLFLAPLLAAAACGGNEAADARSDDPRTPPAVQPATAREGAAPANASAPVGAPAAQPAVSAPEPQAATGRPVAPPHGPAVLDPIPAAPQQPLTSPVVESAPEAPAAETPADEQGASAAQILQRVERNYGSVRSMQADFVQELRVPLLGQNTRSTGKIYQRRPDRFLMKFTQPVGDVIVADGRSFWMYYPSNDPKQVMKTSIAAGSQQVDLQKQFLSNPNQRYNSRLGGEETVDGRRAYVLTLVPRQQSPYKQLRIWVDKGDYSVRRFEMTEQNESVRRLEFRNLKTNVALPDALFSFTPPRGAQVFQQ